MFKEWLFSGALTAAITITPNIFTFVLSRTDKRDTNEIGRFSLNLKKKKNSLSQTVSVIRKDILSPPFNWDDLHPRAKLALRANDSHLASWLFSKQQMLIRCKLGRHPSQEVHDKSAIKDRGGHTERRTVDGSWRLGPLPLTETSDWKRSHLLH